MGWGLYKVFLAVKSSRNRVRAAHFNELANFLQPWKRVVPKGHKGEMERVAAAVLSLGTIEEAKEEIELEELGGERGDSRGKVNEIEV